MANVVEATEKQTTSSKQKTAKETNAVAATQQKQGFLMNASLTKLVAVWGLVKGAIGSAKAALMAMPEIGQTFKIAGDIMMRNFLQPIRQTLLPLLNKILKWVADNRAKFVEWGSFVLNIIETVIGVVKQFVELLTVAFKSFSETMKGVFGDFSQSFGDIIRLLITKIAATFVFLMVLLEPIFKVLGKLIGFIVIGIKGILSGIAKQVSFVMSAVNGLIEAIVELFDNILGGADDAKSFFTFMEKIGQLIAVVFGVAVRWITLGVKLIGQFIAGFKEGFSFIEGIGDAFDELIQVFKEIGDALGLMSEEGSIIMDIFKGIGKVIGFLVGMFVKLIVKGLTIFLKIIKFLIVNIPKLIKFIGSGLKSAFNAMVGAISTAIKFLKNFFKPVKTIFTSIGNFFSTVWDGFIKFGKAAFDKVTGWAKGLFRWLGKVWDSIVGIFKSSEKTSKSLDKTRKGMKSDSKSPLIVPKFGTGSTNTRVNNNVSNVFNINGAQDPKKVAEEIANIGGVPVRVDINNDGVSALNQSALEGGQ
jgi:phage-related protein